MRRFTCLVSMLVLNLSLPAPAGRASDWPRYRGPDGTGVSADPIPTSFSPKKSLLWKAEIPGVGHSSPIVVGDKVFIQSASADGQERWMLCFSAVTGKELWRRSVLGNTSHTHPKNSLASSTPAADAGHVYGVFWDGRDLTLQGYDFAGELLWRRDLGAFTSQHGAGASPIVHDGIVYLLNDQDGASVLLAFDGLTGKPVWQAQRKPFRACYGTPFVHRTKAGTPELIVADTAGVTGYDLKTGTVFWDWSWAFDKRILRVVASPILAGTLVIANSGDGSGDCHTVAVRLGGSGDVTKTNLAWEKKKAMPYVPGFLTHGNHLYYITDKGIAGCLEAATGKEVWTERLGNAGFTSSPVLVNGNIYAVNEQGVVFVIKAAPKFQPPQKNDLGEPVFSTPAVATNLFIRGQSHLFCFGKPAAR